MTVHTSRQRDYVLKMKETPSRMTSDVVSAMPQKPWFLYLLECAGGRIYTGITVDVEARYAAHVAGKGARFTRAHPPSRILWSVSFVDRSAASRAEYRIKQLSASQKRGLIAGTYVCDPRRHHRPRGRSQGTSRA